jgi:hypothetical protein
MIQAMKKLDFLGWIYGLLHAVIGGGASAVIAGISAGLVAPKELAFGGMGSVKLMGACFVVNALLSAFMYLKDSPVPNVIESVTTTQTVSSSTTVTPAKE